MLNYKFTQHQYWMGFSRIETAFGADCQCLGAEKTNQFMNWISFPAHNAADKQTKNIKGESGYL